jgi:phosphatidylinositol kinase/protein kinase (PI-3  family)
MPVDPDARYKDIVYIKGFDDQIKFAGGITVPKKIFCKGSDGV